MKVRVAWYPWRLRIPQVCASCGAGNVPLENMPTEVLKVKRISKTTYQHIKSNINFPYCWSCAEDLKKGRGLFGLFHKKPAVEASMVQTKKYGKLFRRKELEFIELTFTNDTYAQLFTEANKDILLENVLAELKKNPQ